MPGGETPEAVVEAGERTGRRRNRRGGRGGRDREDARGAEATVDADGTPAVAGLVPVVAGADVELAPSNAVDAAPVPTEEGATAEAGEREGRRRNRGRGRDRQRRSEEGSGEQQASLESTGHVAADLTRAVIPPPIKELPADATAPATAIDEEAAHVRAATPAPVEAAPSSAPAPAPIAVNVTSYALPIGELQAVAEQHGLQWVNSDAEKILAAQIAIANEPKPVHVPREIKPVVLVDDGPLVLVETRKDLSQVRLPFETN